MSLLAISTAGVKPRPSDSTSNHVFTQFLRVCATTTSGRWKDGLLGPLPHRSNRCLLDLKISAANGLHRMYNAFCPPKGLVFRSDLESLVPEACFSACGLARWTVAEQMARRGPRQIRHGSRPRCRHYIHRDCHRLPLRRDCLRPQNCAGRVR